MNCCIDRFPRTRNPWPWAMLCRAGWVACLVAFALGATAWAAPFDKNITFTQPDGTRLVLHAKGDEFSAHTETLDGYTVVFDPAQKAYCFAAAQQDGTLVSTGVQVQGANPATLGLAPGLRPGAAARQQLIQARYQRWEEAMQVRSRWSQLKAASRTAAAASSASGSGLPAQFSPPTVPTIGLKVGLTLLVDFSDAPGTVPQADIIDFCNGDNYTGYGNNGSVKQYFQDVSGGRLTYSNVVTVYVRVSQPKSYYNDVTQDSGHMANLMIKDALDALKALPNYTTEILPTFDALTVDNNNQVVACNVFFAGANSGVWTMGLWPHAWSLVEVGAQELSAGGKKVWRYEITDIGDTLSIGTFCHENGHMLCGFPDLYDYEYDSAGGAANFSLMASGNYDHNPVQVDAYLKLAAGWATTTELDATSSFQAMVYSGRGPNFNHFYRYQKPGVPTEYYLIENRQALNRDALIPGPGIAIWHVDELGDRDNQSLVYNTAHANYELTLVQADNRWDLENNSNYGDGEDLFFAGNPAAGYVNRFSDVVNPSARWWSGALSGLLLSDFSDNAPVMTFRVGTGGDSSFQLMVSTNLVSGGNGNGAFDANECDQFYVVLTNYGTVGASNLQATLTTTNADVFITQPNSVYPDLPAGTSATNFSPFGVSLAPSFVCGTPIRFTLALKADQTTLSYDFVVPSGLIGPAVRFDNSAATFIPDRGQTNSIIVVSNLNFAITKMTASVYISHTYDSDLILQLVAPDGTTNTLSRKHGASGLNYGFACSPDSQRTTFDDGATTAISAGNPPFLGSYRPDEPLAVFAGKSGTNINGPWQLVVSDTAGGDVGVIHCWSLSFTPAICTDGGGECPGSDLSVGMIAQPEPVIVGDLLTYTLSVTNRGPGGAKNVAVSQVLPATALFVSAISSQGSCAEVGGIMTASLGRLSAGGTATIAVTVRPLAAGVMTSSASAHSDQPDFDLSNNSATILSHVNPTLSDVAVGLGVSPNALTIGSNFTYTVTVTNFGPSTASGVMVTNVLPAGVVLLDQSISQGSLAAAGNTVICYFGAITNGARATATLKALASAEGALVAKATVVANQIDPILANNTATAVVSVGPAADLALSMTAWPSPAVVGSNVTFVTTVTNRGPSVATSVTVNQILPPGVTIRTNGVSQGSLSLNGSNLVCSLGSLSQGAAASVTVVLASSGTATLVSSATVGGSQADPIPANNAATASVQAKAPFVSLVPAGATLVAENLSPANGSIDLGETVTVQFRLQNVGNVGVTNVKATLLATGGVTSPSAPQTYTNLQPVGVPGGRALAMPFTFRAGGSVGGSLVATLQLQDASGTLAPVTFSFALPTLTTFANTNAMVIPDPNSQALPGSGPANPYPSIINVTGFTSQVSKVTATLAGLTHAYAQDLNVLLVGPSGAKVLLMSHAGAFSAADNLTLTFDDTAASPLPGTGALFSGSWQPSNYLPTPGFSNPAPAGPYSLALAEFNGVDPNGPWKLFVLDDSQGDAGQLAQGWSLNFTGVTPVSQVADLNLKVTAAPAALRVGENLACTFLISNAGPGTANGVVFSNAVPAGFSPASISSSQGYCTNYGALIVGQLASIPAGSTATVTVLLKAAPAALAADATSGWLTNSATITAFETDLHSADNVATAVIPIARPNADVALQWVGPDSVVVGSNLTYSLVVTNAGTNTALSLVVTNPLLASVRLLSATASQGTVATNGGALVATFGDLAPGASAKLNVSLIPLSAGTFTNTATLTGFSTDLSSANNAVVAPLTVINPAPALVAVGAVLQAESIYPANGSIEAGETVTVALRLANVGLVDTANLVATLLPGGGVAAPSAPAAYGRLSAGGASVARPFTFTAGATADGSILATVQLQDGNASLGTVTFAFNLPAVSAFSNTNAIIIPDHGIASPYPSTIAVSGLTGLVGKVSVSLQGVSHSFPKDMNALLVSPAGGAVLLMSHAGGAYALTNVTLTFDDAAGAVLPAASLISSGAYQPTRYGTAVSFPPAAPAGPYASGLGALQGSNPNGAWTLYLLDDSLGDSGLVASGWSLNLTTVNPVNPLTDVAVGMSANATSVPLGSAVTYTLSVTNLGAAAAPAVRLENVLPDGFNLLSNYTSQGSISLVGNRVLCNLGTLNPGDMATVSLKVIPTVPGLFFNTASAAGGYEDTNARNDAAQASILVTGSLPARLTGALANGSFQVTLTAEPNGSYVIQASTNLTTWVPLSTNVVPGTGSVSLTDTNASGLKARFYRAVRSNP